MRVINGSWKYSLPVAAPALKARIVAADDHRRRGVIVLRHNITLAQACRSASIVAQLCSP